MFASLKNRIKEETGSDLSKLTAKITSSNVQRIDSLRGRSQQGSTSSLNSIVSSEGARDDNRAVGSDVEDYRKRLAKIEQDFARKLESKEAEWRETVLEKDRLIRGLEGEKEEAQRLIASLQDSLKSAQEFKQKILDHKENSDQIETFQSQELQKVKQLVLLRDKELAEKTSALKEANSQLEKLRGEVARLRRQEEQLSDVQDDLESLRHSSARDLAALASQLAKSEEDRRHLSDVVEVLRQRVSNETSDNEHFASERKLLEQRLEAAHLQLTDIKTSWSDKIASLETQVGRLSRQAAEEGAERRRTVQEKEKLFDRVKQLEAELEYTTMLLNTKETTAKRLTAEINELSFELKSIRMSRDEEVALFQTELDNVRTELKVVRKNLENSESELDKTGDECSKLKLSVDSEHLANNSLRQLLTKLEKELNEEKSNSLNVQKTLSRVTSEKNSALLRNAEISQQMEMVRQEMRRQEKEMTELLSKVSQLEELNEKLLDNRKVEQQLKSTVNELEDQIMEKNKNIKTLQLRLADMKKTLQQELRTPGHPSYHSDLIDNSSSAILMPSQNSTRNFPNNVKRDDDDVNFKYLKHVVIKFLTSDYEAQHLIKAISTLLKFTPDEEKLIQETLEWKRSWWGSKPKTSAVAPKSKNLPS